MQCPVCPGTTLVMTNRENVEIDYCPKCRGVWLDRGELDKIIERSLSLTPAAPSAPPRVDPRMDPRYAQGGGYRHDDDDHYKKYGKKRRGFLGDIFDFD
jgi:Zn-finger nucleic acid-binding protein